MHVLSLQLRVLTCSKVPFWLSQIREVIKHQNDFVSRKLFLYILNIGFISIWISDLLQGGGWFSTFSLTCSLIKSCNKPNNCQKRARFRFLAASKTMLPVIYCPYTSWFKKQINLLCLAFFAFNSLSSKYYLNNWSSRVSKSSVTSRSETHYFNSSPPTGLWHSFQLHIGFKITLVWSLLHHTNCIWTKTRQIQTLHFSIFSVNCITCKDYSDDSPIYFFVTAFNQLQVQKRTDWIHSNKWHQNIMLCLFAINSKTGCQKNRSSGLRLFLVWFGDAQRSVSQEGMFVTNYPLRKILKCFGFISQKLAGVKGVSPTPKYHVERICW